MLSLSPNPNVQSMKKMSSLYPICLVPSENSINTAYLSPTYLRMVLLFFSMLWLHASFCYSSKFPDAVSLNDTLPTDILKLKEKWINSGFYPNGEAPLFFYNGQSFRRDELAFFKAITAGKSGALNEHLVEMLLAPDKEGLLKAYGLGAKYGVVEYYDRALFLEDKIKDIWMDESLWDMESWIEEIKNNPSGQQETLYLFNGDAISLPRKRAHLKGLELEWPLVLLNHVPIGVKDEAWFEILSQANIVQMIKYDAKDAISIFGKDAKYGAFAFFDEDHSPRNNAFQVSAEMLGDRMPLLMINNRSFGNDLSAFNQALENYSIDSLVQLPPDHDATMNLFGVEAKDGVIRTYGTWISNQALPKDPKYLEAINSLIKDSGYERNLSFDPCPVLFIDQRYIGRYYPKLESIPLNQIIRVQYIEQASEQFVKDWGEDCRKYGVLMVWTQKKNVQDKVVLIDGVKVGTGKEGLQKVNFELVTNIMEYNGPSVRREFGIEAPMGAINYLYKQQDASRLDEGIIEYFKLFNQVVTTEFGIPDFSNNFKLTKRQFQNLRISREFVNHRPILLDGSLIGFGIEGLKQLLQTQKRYQLLRQHIALPPEIEEMRREYGLQHFVTEAYLEKINATPKVYWGEDIPDPRAYLASIQESEQIPLIVLNDQLLARGEWYKVIQLHASQLKWIMEINPIRATEDYGALGGNGAIVVETKDYAGQDLQKVSEEALIARNAGEVSSRFFKPLSKIRFVVDNKLMAKNFDPLLDLDPQSIQNMSILSAKEAETEYQIEREFMLVRIRLKKDNNN